MPLALTAGRDGILLDGFEFVSDETVDPEVTRNEEQDHEGVEVPVVHPQRFLLDGARAVLLLVAERHNSLPGYWFFIDGRGSPKRGAGRGTRQQYRRGSDVQG